MIMTDIISDIKLRNLLAAISEVESENERLKDENERSLQRITVLEETLRFAHDCVTEWGSYADDYFREKHDLIGDLAKIEAILESKP
jgi:hypothetical protein